MRFVNFKTVLILVIICSFAVKNTFSQNTFSGFIYDAKNNEPLIGANVYFPDLHKGSTTYNEGEFECTDIITGKFDMFVSFIGYRNKLIKLQTDTIKHKLIIFLEAEEFQSQEIIISGSRFSLQHENAIEVNSLKLSALDNQGTNIIAKIAEIPGVDLISKGAGIEKPVIRGLSNTNVLFIDNGIRMENFQFSENHPFMVDEFGIERIEVVKGPASLLYGSDAVGGVLYAIREKPPHNDKFKGDYTFQYFDNSKGLNSSIGLQKRHKNFHAGIRASIKSHKDNFDGNNTQIPNSRFNQRSIKSVVGYSHKKGNFDLYYDFSEMILGMCIEPAIAIVTDNNRDNEFWYQSLSNHIIAIKNKLFFNSLKININAAFQSNNRKLMGSELTPKFKMVDMLLNTFSAELKSTYSFKKSELICGIQSMYQKNKNANAPLHIIPDAEIFNVSIFSLFSSNIKDKFHYQTGLRYDYRNINTQQDEKKDKTNNNYQNVSFSTGFTYQFTKKLLLRANFASAHRSPNIAELTQDGIHGAYYEKGNAKLKSQRNYEPDISLHYHANKFIFEISTFYNNITDYIFLQKTNNTTDDGTAIYEYSQTDANISGIETGIKIMPFNFIQFQSNYAFISAKQNDGEYLPFIPHNKINSSLKFFSDKILFFDKPFFTINSVYAFRQENPSAFETVTPKYFITNLSIGFEKKINNIIILFSAGVNNVLNELYIDHLSTLKELHYYQTGRNFNASFKLKF